jgi:hypothetical protein
MKTLKVTIFLTLFFIFLPALDLNSQDLQAEERAVAVFNGISITVPGEVYIIQGPTQRLILEGTERVIENLVTEVKRGKLIISAPPRWNFRRNDQLKVYITVSELNSLEISGSASINTEGTLRSDNMAVTISGSGRIEFEELSADELTSVISGSGRVYVGSGTELTNQTIRISGSGRVESASVPAGKVNITISGSGRCYVYALADLHVRVSGSGRVVYTGTPLVDSRISGSGRIVSSR